MNEDRTRRGAIRVATKRTGSVSCDAARLQQSQPVAPGMRPAFASAMRSSSTPALVAALIAGCALPLDGASAHKAADEVRLVELHVDALIVSVERCADNCWPVLELVNGDGGRVSDIRLRGVQPRAVEHETLGDARRFSFVRTTGLRFRASNRDIFIRVVDGDGAAILPATPVELEATSVETEQATLQFHVRASTATPYLVHNPCGGAMLAAERFQGRFERTIDLSPGTNRVVVTAGSELVLVDHSVPFDRLSSIPRAGMRVPFVPGSTPIDFDAEVCPFDLHIRAASNPSWRRDLAPFVAGFSPGHAVKTFTGRGVLADGLDPDSETRYEWPRASQLFSAQRAVDTGEVEILIAHSHHQLDSCFLTPFANEGDPSAVCSNGTQVEFELVPSQP